MSSGRRSRSAADGRSRWTLALEAPEGPPFHKQRPLGAAEAPTSAGHAGRARARWAPFTPPSSRAAGHKLAQVGEIGPQRPPRASGGQPPRRPQPRGKVFEHGGGHLRSGRLGRGSVSGTGRTLALVSARSWSGEKARRTASAMREPRSSSSGWPPEEGGTHRVRSASRGRGGRWCRRAGRRVGFQSGVLAERTNPRGCRLPPEQPRRRDCRLRRWLSGFRGLSGRFRTMPGWVRTLWRVIAVRRSCCRRR
jgi:hypothetical protein